MYTNKTGDVLCADKDGNIVPCDSPESAFVVVGPGGQLGADEAKKYNGLPKGDDNAPPEDTDPGDEQEQPEPEPAQEPVQTPQPTTPESEAAESEAAEDSGAKAVEKAPAHKMETGKATKTK